MGKMYCCCKLEFILCISCEEIMVSTVVSVDESDKLHPIDNFTFSRRDSAKKTDTQLKLCDTQTRTTSTDIIVM